MPLHIKKYAVKSLILLLQAFRFIGNLLLKVFSFVAIPFMFLWKIGLRKVAFWVYKRILKFKIASGRVVSPVKRTFFSIFGHRYVVHGMIAFIVVFVSVKNIHAREVDLGEASQESLIFAMVQGADDVPRTEMADASDEGFLNFTFESFETDSATTTLPVPLGTDAGLLAYDAGVLKAVPTTDEETAIPEERPEIAQPTTYTVRSGDTISGIAKSFGISINTVLWANNMTARSVIRPGQKLTILPTTGVQHTVKRGENLGVIARKYGTEIDDILEANDLASASLLQIGQELLIPGGKPPVAPRPKVTTPTRLASVQKVFSAASEPPPSKAAAVGSLVWPTDQRRINQYFKWRHSGIDINGNFNNAIYAIDDGIVTLAGWNRHGYGNQIMINHGNGMKSRYAHNSKHFVKAGDQVKKGQTIAMIGSTGRSTGPHIHFEIYVNGRRVNPLNYYR